MRGGDFSTPLRFGRNDERVACCHRHLERGCMPLWETDRNRSHDTLSREISCRNAARTMRGGDFSTLWRLCIESPSQPKLASSLHNKRLSYWRLTGCGRNDGRWSDIGVIHAFLHSPFMSRRGAKGIFLPSIFLPVIYHLRRIFNEFYVPHITTYFLV